MRSRFEFHLLVTAIITALLFYCSY